MIPSFKTVDENNASYNIEGKGITPDILISQDSALGIAYKLAYKGNLSIAGQKIKYFNKSKAIKDIPGFERSYVDYEGNYRKLKIFKDNGRLYMIYDTFYKRLLSPIGKDLFLSDSFESIRFVRSINAVVSIEIKHQDGYTETFRKL